MSSAKGGGTTGAVLITIACFGIVFFLVPIVSLLAQTPWDEGLRVLGHRNVLLALRLSLLVSTSAVVFSLLIGFPIAWVLARYRFYGQSVVRALVLLPMVLPPVVGGVALLGAFGRQGILGSVLERVGIHLPFTTAGAVLAVSFVAGPFMVATLEAGLKGLDHEMEDAAAALGASKWMILFRVILPALKPSLLAGIALTWARALGEFGATIAFAGNMPGRTQTLPLAIYQTLHTDLKGAYLLSALLLGVSLMILVALRGKVSR